MNLTSSPVRRFFKLRLLASLVAFAGFCLCAGKAWQPLAAPILASAQESSSAPAVIPEGAISPVPEAVPASGLSAPGAVPAGVESGASLPPLTPALVIDAGHGGADGGTPAGNMIEKEWTLKVALSLAEELRSRGHVVDLIRSGDETVPLAERPALVNAFPRTAMISIHFNAGAADASGIETWYSWPKRPEIMTELHTAAGVSEEAQLPDEGMALAQAIQSAAHEKTGARDRGTKNRTDLALTSRCLCPAVIVECGFLSNAEEGKLIRESSYRAKLVRGIADGYETWLLNRSGSTPVSSATGTGTEHREPPKTGDAGAEH